MAKRRVSDGETASHGPDPLPGRGFPALERATGEARGLPRGLYTDPALLRLEQEKIFARRWCCAGFVHELKEPGDAAPASVAGAPVLLLRNKEGAIRAFHNVCRHRGATILNEPCKGRTTLVCPYHRWTYDLDGKLRATPRVGGPERHEVETIVRDKLGLVPARCATWHDWIFVNLDGEAPPLEEAVRPLEAHLANYDLSLMRHGASLEFDIKANWKLIHENFIECYHNHFIHPDLDEIAPAADHEMIAEEACVGLRSRTYYPAKGYDGSTPLPAFPGIPKSNLDDGVYLHFFPTMDMNVWREVVVTMHVWPLAPDRTHERFEFYFVGDAALTEAHAGQRRQIVDIWKEVNDQDIEIVERMQEGRASPAMDGGVFSPYWETTVHRFHRMVAEALA